MSLLRGSKVGIYQLTFAFIIRSLLTTFEFPTLSRPLECATGHSVHEVHGFEFLAKTIFANNLKTIDLRVSTYDWLNFPGSKNVQNVSVQLIIFEIRPKKYLLTGA